MLSGIASEDCVTLGGPGETVYDIGTRKRRGTPLALRGRHVLFSLTLTIPRPCRSTATATVDNFGGVLIEFEWDPTAVWYFVRKQRFPISPELSRAVNRVITKKRSTEPVWLLAIPGWVPAAPVCHGGGKPIECGKLCTLSDRLVPDRRCVGPNPHLYIAWANCGGTHATTDGAHLFVEDAAIVGGAELDERLSADKRDKMDDMRCWAVEKALQSITIGGLDLDEFEEWLSLADQAGDVDAISKSLVDANLRELVTRTAIEGRIRAEASLSMMTAGIGAIREEHRAAHEARDALRAELDAMRADFANAQKALAHIEASLKERCASDAEPSSQLRAEIAALKATQEKLQAENKSLKALHAEPCRHCAEYAHVNAQTSPARSADSSRVAELITTIFAEVDNVIGTKCTAPATAVQQLTP